MVLSFSLSPKPCLWVPHSTTNRWIHRDSPVGPLFFHSLVSLPTFYPFLLFPPAIFFPVSDLTPFLLAHSTQFCRRSSDVLPNLSDCLRCPFNFFVYLFQMISTSKGFMESVGLEPVLCSSRSSGPAFWFSPLVSHFLIPGVPSFGPFLDKPPFFFPRRPFLPTSPPKRYLLFFFYPWARMANYY